jgi:hypothetical protein
MGNIYYFSKIINEDSDRGNKIRKLITLSFLALIAVNLPLISAYIVLNKYGDFTLYPGEDYIINIPFTSSSDSFATICGTAQKTNGISISGINVTLRYYGNSSDYAKNITDLNGRFCFNVDIDSNQKFDVYAGYDNSTLILGNNNYNLDFDNYKVYRKSSDNYTYLSGNITNYDAPITNGRFEIKMGQHINGSWSYSFGDYQAFYINISSNSIYHVPSSQLNFSKYLGNLSEGEYKFLIKSSFNANEKSSVYVFFNITS